MLVLGISGSLRADSYNTQLLRAAEELLPDGVAFELYDGLPALPPYDQVEIRTSTLSTKMSLLAAIATLAGWRPSSSITTW